MPMHLLVALCCSTWAFASRVVHVVPTAGQPRVSKAAPSKAASAAPSNEVDALQQKRCCCSKSSSSVQTFCTKISWGGDKKKAGVIRGWKKKASATVSAVKKMVEETYTGKPTAIALGRAYYEGVKDEIVKRDGALYKPLDPVAHAWTQCKGEEVLVGRIGIEGHCAALTRSTSWFSGGKLRCPKGHFDKDTPHNSLGSCICESDCEGEED
eukprot:TRINITY_DN73941_c0_g1_i1.p1 TRINITY_DN73941_c0_g1~~TRINITY_DN73941_c0_g1_i1.p1  ORF type:complete len:211 (+),score=19.20 TRINITY_DN73941_c0_g1_i1:56-688(+)